MFKTSHKSGENSDKLSVFNYFSWPYTRQAFHRSWLWHHFRIRKGLQVSHTYLEVETRVSCFDFNLSDFNLCDYFSGDIHNEQEVCKVREDSLPHGGTEMPGQGRYLNNGGFCWRLIRAPSSCFRLYNINTLDTDTEIVIGNSFISDTICFEVDIESIIFRCTATVEKWAGPIFKPCCNISNLGLWT